MTPMKMTEEIFQVPFTEAMQNNQENTMKPITAKSLKISLLESNTMMKDTTWMTQSTKEIQNIRDSTQLLT